MKQNSIHIELDSIIGKKEDRKTLHIGNNTLIVEKIFRAPVTKYCRDMFNRRNIYKHNILPNFEFYIRFYFPRSKLVRRIDSKSNDNMHIIIMFNGLNESLDKHYKLYDRLGSSFAYCGISSVLLPTPFHLNRAARLKENEKRVKIPSDSLMENPWYLPNNFAQTIYEFNYLFKLLNCDFDNFQNDSIFKNVDIRNPTEDDMIFYNLFFGNKKLDISLLGYSLGGLKALTCFKYKPDFIKTCILINSGGTLKNLKLGPPLMKNDIWQEEIVEHLLKRRIQDNQRKEFSAFEDCEHYEIIHSILFDEEKVFDSIEFDKHIGKIIIVAGGKDRLVEPETIKRLESSAHGLNILQIADLGHFVSDDPQFNRWFSRIINLLVDFFEDIEGESISKEANLILFATINFLCNNELVKCFENSTKLTEIENIVKNKIGNDIIEEDILLILRTSLAYFDNVENFLKELKKVKLRNNLYFGQQSIGLAKSNFPKIEEIINKTDGSLLAGQKLLNAEELMEHQINIILEKQTESYINLLNKKDFISENWKQLYTQELNKKNISISSTNSFFN